MNFKEAVFIPALALILAASSHAVESPTTTKERKRGQDQTKERPNFGKTLDKSPPAPRPGEGFLIRGREGSAMDAGRPKQGARADWDLWRK